MTQSPNSKRIAGTRTEKEGSAQNWQSSGWKSKPFLKIFRPAVDLIVEPLIWRMDHEYTGKRRDEPAPCIIQAADTGRHPATGPRLLGFQDIAQRRGAWR